jgi:hypothetical protein
MWQSSAVLMPTVSLTAAQSPTAKRADLAPRCARRPCMQVLLPLLLCLLLMLYPGP